MQFDPNIVQYMISMIEGSFAPIKQDKFPEPFITHREGNAIPQKPNKNNSSHEKLHGRKILFIVNDKNNRTL